MPLTASQLRVIIVIIVTCVAINLVLYSSAVFSATSADQLDGTIAGSDYSSLTKNHTKGRISSSLRFSQGKTRHVHRIKRVHKKGRKRNSEWSSESNRFFDSHARGESGEEDRAEEDGGHSKMLLESSKAASSELRFVNTTRSKAVHTKTRASSPAKPSDDFNISRTVLLFEGCIDDDDQISIDCFNDAYEELSKLFRPLGTVFSFVILEIQEKITILRQYRQHPVRGPHFLTVQSMVQYEMDHKLTVQSNKPSGARTFLRLHWALQFISALVRKIKDMDRKSKFSDEVSEVYDRTLAQHHPWLMRKAVHLAVYALPDRPELLMKLHMKDTPAEMAQVEALITELEAIYDISQDLYAKNRLLDLP